MIPAVCTNATVTTMQKYHISLHRTWCSPAEVVFFMEPQDIFKIGRVKASLASDTNPGSSAGKARGRTPLLVQKIPQKFRGGYELRAKALGGPSEGVGLPWPPVVLWLEGATGAP